MLAWSLRHGIGVLPGTVSVHHATEVVDACYVELDEGEMETIDKLNRLKSYRGFVV